MSTDTGAQTYLANLAVRTVRDLKELAPAEVARQATATAESELPDGLPEHVAAPLRDMGVTLVLRMTRAAGA